MIAIKNMTMPTMCRRCLFCVLPYIAECSITRSCVEDYFNDGAKPSWCPLVELPNTPRNPEDAYREDFGKEKDNDGTGDT